MPRPVRVQSDEHGLPSKVALDPSNSRAPSFAVERVEEVWRIAEEWWRETPIGRTYYRVVIDGGRSLTLFHDTGQPHDTEGPGQEDGQGGRQWYEQRY
jgi:hypothetical protein